MGKTIDKIKFILWRIIYTPIFRIKYWATRKDRKRLNILDSESTCNLIAASGCSVCRFGDGEFQIIEHWLSKRSPDIFKVDSFQQFDSRLGERLYSILKEPIPNLLCCIPYPFKDSSVYKGYDRLFFEREYLVRKNFLNSLGPENLKWGDTDFTRFYLHRTDIKSYLDYIGKLKQLWDNRHLLIVEGEFSRLGVGNDLFDNAASINRLLCPAKNSFSKYDSILNKAIEYGREKTIILALGQTATVLAYDLCKAGIQALDLGHIDVEYEWYRMGAKEKVAIPDKYVNEVREGRIASGSEDKEYLSQVVDIIRG